MNRAPWARTLSAACTVGLAVMGVTGCGGGGGSGAATPAPGQPAPMAVLGGKVIDGYVSGATVWLDINGNHVKDADEPSTVSKAAGAYQLELSEAQRACLPYATLYVDVPVGAVDEDSGPVKEAYQMAVAPRLQAISVDQVLHISPLTSAIWDQVRTRLSATAPNLSSCEQLLANQPLREQLIYEIKTVMAELVSRHNLSEARIHDDFIKSKDEHSHQLAQDIVKGLKAGYAYKQRLHAQYPDASFIRAEVYRGRGTRQFDDQAGVWYRNASVWRPAGYLNEWVVLDESLSQVRRVLNLRRQDSQPWGAATLKTTRTAYNFQTDRSDYICARNEAVEQTQDGVRYELVVHYEDPRREADPHACFSEAHAAAPGSVGLREYYADYRAGRVSYLSNLRFYPEHPEHAQLTDWHTLAGKNGQLDFTRVIQRIAASGYRFEEEVKLPTAYWLKRSTDDTALRVTVEKRDTGAWIRISTLADGTSRQDCSTDQGKTWNPCAG